MSDDGDDDNKTEDPTPKKLEEARKKGQVPLSREVNNWVMLSAGTLVVLSMGPQMMESIMTVLKTYIADTADLPAVPGGFVVVVAEAFKEIMRIVALPMVFLMAAAFFGPFAQIGPLFSTETITPDLSKLSPAKGFSRLFSLRSIMEFVKGILKITIISVVGMVILTPFFGGLEHMVGLPIPLAMTELGTLVKQLMVGFLTVLFIIAAADLFYQRFEFYKKMRMSKQELKDEYRQSEGDPVVKSKLRQLRQQKAQARMMQAVPSADVVITNPTHYSVALTYNPDENEAPIVVAKGVNEVAMRIRETAREHNIMILPNPPLARVLFDTVDLDQAVPPEHYKAVAEIISYVFKLKGKLK